VPCKARNPDASRVFYCPFTLQCGAGGRGGGGGGGRSTAIPFASRAHTRVKGKREIASFRPPRVIARGRTRGKRRSGLPSANRRTRSYRSLVPADRWLVKTLSSRSISGRAVHARHYGNGNYAAVTRADISRVIRYPRGLEGGGGGEAGRRLGKKANSTKERKERRAPPTPDPRPPPTTTIAKGGSLFPGNRFSARNKARSSPRQRSIIRYSRAFRFAPSANPLPPPCRQAGVPRETCYNPPLPPGQARCFGCAWHRCVRRPGLIFFDQSRDGKEREEEEEEEEIEGDDNTHPCAKWKAA